MVKIMDTLREDHENLGTLLVVLERQCDLLAEGAKADYDLLEEIVEYCLGYPDTYHHPIEDAVYERLRSRSPDLMKEFASLREQHHELQRITRQLGDTVRALEVDGIMRREPVVQLMRDFIELYREHIDWEETAFFPAAEQHLSAEDWEQLEKYIEAQQDPLFASLGKDQYLAIRKDLQRASEGS